MCSLHVTAHYCTCSVFYLMVRNVKWFAFGTVPPSCRGLVNVVSCEWLPLRSSEFEVGLSYRFSPSPRLSGSGFVPVCYLRGMYICDRTAQGSASFAF